MTGLGDESFHYPIHRVCRLNESGHDEKVQVGFCEKHRSRSACESRLIKICTVQILLTQACKKFVSICVNSDKSRMYRLLM